MIDTRNKRASVLGLAMVVTLVLPAPDPTGIEQPDRQHLACCYAGLVAAAPPSPAPAPVIQGGGGIAMAPGRVRRTWRTDRGLPETDVAGSRRELEAAAPQRLVGIGTVAWRRPDVDGAGAVGVVGRAQARYRLGLWSITADLRVVGSGQVTVGAERELKSTGQIDDPLWFARGEDEWLTLA